MNPDSILRPRSTEWLKTFGTQLVDIYRLVEDELDVPTVAFEFIRGMVFYYWTTLLSPSVSYYVTRRLWCRFTLYDTRLDALLERLRAVRSLLIKYLDPQSLALGWSSHGNIFFRQGKEDFIPVFKKKREFFWDLSIAS